MAGGRTAPLPSTSAQAGVPLSGSAVHSAAPEWARSGVILTRRRRWFVLTGLAAAAVAVIILSSCFGAAPVTGGDWLAVLRDAAASGHVTETAGVILLHVRLPRVFMGFLVGGTLAVVGVTLQALLRNALADPYVLGVSSGAAVGTALATLLGVEVISLGALTLPLWGFAGGMAALALVYRVAQSHGRLPLHSLLLTGMILNAVLTAVIMFVTSIMAPARAAGLMAWLMGSLTAPGWGAVLGLAVYVTAGTALLLCQAPILNLMAQGEDTARSLGVDTERMKKRLYAVTALLTGAVVSASGMIGFVGTVIPHMIRMVAGSDHRLLMPASALMGGIFLVVSDTVARTAFAPAEIPAGIVTAMAGGPFFLYLLLRRKDRMV